MTASAIAIFMISLSLNAAPCHSSPLFRVLWNVPSEHCLLTYGINLMPFLVEYGIQVNAGDKFQGEIITIFYKDRLGLYPRIDSSGEDVNGGIPQSANISEHLKKAAVDINNAIPDEQWTGLGVIDWESWRPVWNFNWGSLKQYQNRSLQKVRDEHPSWSEDLVEKLAQHEWETSAKSLMLKTLNLATNLRSNGSWCFYLFPDCYNYKGSNPQQFSCPRFVQKGNDKLKWLWDASPALCPSLYVGDDYLKKYSFRQLTWYANGRLQEALLLRSPEALLYPYVGYGITPGTMVPEDHFWRILAQVASAGSEGTVVWGSSASVGSKNLCLQLQEYVVNILGPAVKTITRNTIRCTITVCNNKGRCTWPKDPNVVAWKFLVDKKDRPFHAEDIVCRCEKNVSGRYCEGENG